MKQDTGELTCNGGIYWLREHVTRFILVQEGKTYEEAMDRECPDGTS